MTALKRYTTGDRLYEEPTPLYVHPAAAQTRHGAAWGRR